MFNRKNGIGIVKVFVILYLFLAHLSKRVTWAIAFTWHPLVHPSGVCFGRTVWRELF